LSAAHWHLLLNHVPVLGTIFGALLLLAALILRNGTLVRTSLTVFVIVAIATIPVYLTGGGAEEIIEGGPGVSSESLMVQHARFGLIASIAVAVLGLLSLVAMGGARGKSTIPSWIGPSVLIVALVVSGLFAWTATLGGQINHPEIRDEAAVSSPERGEQEE